MNKLLVVVAIVVLVTGLGAAKGVSDVGSGHGEEVTEAVSSTQHDEFDSEGKMQEAIEKDQVKRGMVIAFVATGTWDDLEMERGVKNIRHGKVDGSRREIAVVTFDGDNTPIIKGSAIDRLDDPKQVNSIDPETVDDIRAGKADEGRKEIAVKIQNEERGVAGNSEGEKERGITINNKVVELAHSDENRIGDKVSSISKRSARKGRNPQTGKEIKIPARAEDGHYGREPEEKEVELVIPETPKEKPQRGVKFAIVEKESGEEYFVHATGLIDEIRDEDDVSFELREGRKGMNAVDVRRTD